MAINVGLSRFFPGSGVGTFTAKNNYIAGLSIASTTPYYLPATSSAYTTASPLPFGVTAGRCRIKIYNGAGTSPVLTKLQVFAQDGTNTVLIFDEDLGTTLAMSSTSWYERIFDFILDTASGSTSGGAVGQLINGGATNFKIVATMTGTSPTFTMDVEIIGLI